jgi:hypothetical protein
MQIHWFSPLPPIDVPAAICTAAVVPYLTRAASVVLWTGQAVWDPTMERTARVKRYSLCGFPWREVNRGDLAIFHLGREAEHHGAIWRLFRLHSGIAVLHDARIHELYLRAPRPVSCEDPDFVAECERFYGQAGRLAGEIFRGGLCSPERMAETFPMLEPILEAASGVLVHDGELARTLARRAGPPVVHAQFPLTNGGDPGEYVRTLFRLAASADPGYTASLILAERIARAMKPLAKVQVREAVIDRAAQAISSLMRGPRDTATGQ